LVEVEGLKLKLVEMQVTSQEYVTEIASLENMIEKNSREYMENMNIIEKLLAENERLNNDRYIAHVADLESTIVKNNQEYLKSVDVSTELLRENQRLNLDVLSRAQHVAHLETACAVFKQEITDLEGKVYYAWQEIESLKNANAEIRYHNEKILNSSSWYLTAPLRFFRLNFMTRPYVFTKKAILQMGRGVWRLMPVSTKTRMACKSVLYKSLPFLFKKSEKYQQWKFYQESLRRLQEPQRDNIEQLQHETPEISVAAKALAEIPRIKFDSTQNQFVEYRENPKIEPVVKLIAFYLPQFHPFPENDAWWGKGFTEWTNVTKAYPNYVEHYQPHHPIHMGYYDLRVAEAMEEQARLAKEYGVYGFSYYFYWFAGKILMDTPLEQMLANPKVDMPFCFTWANENWSRRWDGQENDILIAQHHSDEDSINFIRHLFKYFKDDRYIKIDGKPLLIIYRASIIPNMEKTANIWREELEKNGFPGLYLVCAQSFGIKSPAEFGFDASVEFPPHTVSSTDIRHELNMTNTDFNGHVFSYDQVVANAVASKEPDYKLFRAAMLSWDNTARKQNNSHTFHGFSLLRYKQWLSSITNNVFNNAKYSKDEKLVFVNAWNEWAEGTHLEPDRKFGYGYLQATYDVMAEYDLPQVSRLSFKRSERQNDCAVILHLHYAELWDELKGYLDSLANVGFDLYVTVTSSSAGVQVVKDYPYAHVKLVENRGRDILPFLGVLKTIKDMGYVAVCKIHSKRSVYRMDGDKIRDELMDSLLGSTVVASQIIERFSKKPNLGLIAAGKYLIPHTDHNMTFSGEIVSTLASRLDLNFNYDEFAAGSMFWFKPEALESILSIEESMFAVEDGLADGTLAHGVERIICSVVKNAKYSVESV
jgi:lipopolysaccharide biosynthesis protein